MRTWLLTTLNESERSYRGHSGYDDDLRSVYRYDSFVPNHKQMASGNPVVLRGKHAVLGCAVIERIDALPGTRARAHCPTCNATKLKQRKKMHPRYRCECGATFDEPLMREAACTKYAAWFGNSYQVLVEKIEVQDLWQLAPRLNKQHAMLELSSEGTAELLRSAMLDTGTPDTLPTATAALFQEGQRSTVLVNRYERDPRARAACIKHYGCRCTACGFEFAGVYGPLGTGVIEVHHLERLADSKGGAGVDPVVDLRPLCSNCHTMVHRKQPPLTIDELQGLIKNQ